MKKVLSIIMALLVIPIGSAYALRAKAWAPYKGKAMITTKYLLNYFRFDQMAYNHFHDPLYRFQHTYEQETHTSKGWAKRDWFSYWYSNLPNAYLDTIIGDSRSPVDNYTIGTINAGNLKKETDYYTYIPIKDAKNTSTSVWIKGQWGMINNPYPALDPWKCIAQIDTVTLKACGGPISAFIPWEYK